MAFVLSSYIWEMRGLLLTNYTAEVSHPFLEYYMDGMNQIWGPMLVGWEWVGRVVGYPG